MKFLLKVVGWIGITILMLMAIDNPKAYESKPNEKMVLVVGTTVLVLLLIISIAIAYLYFQ